MSYKFNEIKLEKGMYSQRDKSFTEVLESLDPSENYRGTAFEGMDAFQRQLKRFDIKVKGAGSDRVEKFFTTADSSVLFPEYMARAVKCGLEDSNELPNIVATTTNIDSMYYRSVHSLPSEEELMLKGVGEGSALPTTVMVLNDRTVEMKKRGRLLTASYEAIRFQKLDMFSVMLRQIGNYIATTRLKDAVEVLLSGDGNENAAEVYTVGDDSIGGTVGTIGYNELASFWNLFAPYHMNTMLVSSDVMLQILKCSQFQNPLAGLNFVGSGQVGSPLGAKIIKADSLPAGYVVGLDRSYALEMITAGDVSVEYDRLIDKQMERAAISCITGFEKICDEASKVLAAGG